MVSSGMSHRIFGDTTHNSVNDNISDGGERETIPFYWRRKNLIHPISTLCAAVKCHTCDAHQRLLMKNFFGLPFSFYCRKIHQTNPRKRKMIIKMKRVDLLRMPTHSWHLLYTHTHKLWRERVSLLWQGNSKLFFFFFAPSKKDPVFPGVRFSSPFND